MRKIVVVAAAGIVAVAAAAFAQDRGGPGGPFRGGDAGGPGGGRPPFSAGDRDAFTEARIAALHAGLRLTPDQDKLWPPVEDALRGLARQRQEARAARRERWASLHDSDGPADIPGQLRFMADRQAASADAFRKLADATGPLYGALDEAQKRRVGILTRMMRPGGRFGGGGEGYGRGDGEGRGFQRRGSLDREPGGEMSSRDFAERGPGGRGPNGPR